MLFHFSEMSDDKIYTFFRKKVVHLIFVITSANVDQFLKFFHSQICKKTPYVSVRDFHLNLTMLLHYLVKFENSKQLMN